ncbi:MAG: DsbA family protein [Rhodospirillaceae bacterium]|nr:DsbA family protein [Rhodospirillaceae bacterium]
MSRFILGIALSLLVFSASPVLAGVAPLSESTAEMVIGSPDAPVTMIEYASLTCPHCAAFHTETLPKIKKAYVDTGKVRIIYRDFPLGSLAMGAAMLARCSGTKNYFTMLGALFASQATWARSETPLQALEGIARLSGMTVDDVDSCMNDKALFEHLKNVANEASNSLGVESTPTFFIEGTKVPGNMPFEDFQDILDKAIAKKQ